MTNRDQNLVVRDGRLVVPTATRDFYGTDNTAVPNLVLQDLPDGTVHGHREEGCPAKQDQTGPVLLIWEDQDNYAKMVLQGRSAAADPATRIFQFIREQNAQPNEVNESNSAALGADYPDTVYSCGFVTTARASQAAYSADGIDFTTLQTKSIADLENAKIGLVALKGNNTTPGRRC